MIYWRDAGEPVGHAICIPSSSGYNYQELLNTAEAHGWLRADGRIHEYELYPDAPRQWRVSPKYFRVPMYEQSMRINGRIELAMILVRVAKSKMEVQNEA